VRKSEAPRPEGREFCLTAVLRSLVRNQNILIAPLDPALKDGACGEQAGQGFAQHLLLAILFWGIQPPVVGMD